MIPPADDLDRIMAIMACAFDPVYGEAWNRRQIEDALLVGNCHYQLIAADGGVPEHDTFAAGFCLTRTGYEEEELLLLAVDPAHRGKGLGRLMLDRFKEAAMSRGAKQLLLEMRRGNPAEALYRNFGFTVIGERRNYYRSPSGDRIDAITFSHSADSAKKS